MKKLGLVLALALAGGSVGCSYTKIVRGDLAWEGVKHERPLVPLTVSVAAIKNEAGGDVTADTCFAFSRSYLTVLEQSRVFANVFTDVEAPDADVRFEGAIKHAEVYQNNWYLASWVILGVATFGLFPGIGALFGLPYSTENGDIRLAVRAVDGRTGSIIATYDTTWEDTLVFNIYNSGSVNKETFYVQPKRAVQAACAKNVQAVIADHAKFDALARGKAAAPGAAPGGSTAAGAPQGPPAPPGRTPDPTGPPRPPQ